MRGRIHQKDVRTCRLHSTDLVKLWIKGLLFDLGFVFSFLPHIWLQTPAAK